jgi:hypothetical protein
LKELRQRDDIHVCDIDKNLGPAAGISTNYKSQIFTEHLDTVSYRGLTEDEANEMNAETKGMIRKMFNKECVLPKAEMTYLECSFKLSK